MLKLIKWLAGFAVTLILLIAVAAIVLPRIIDPNDYRDEITALVKEKVGRDLRLGGELTLEVFPWLGIRTQDLSLSQPEQIGGDMVSVQTAQLRVKLMPLLSKKVEVDTVILEQPIVKLVTLKDGTDSFYGLSSEEDIASRDSQSPETAVALVIQGLELTDGMLTIDDRQAGTLKEVSDFNLVTGNLIGDEPASIQASGTLKDSTSPDLTHFNLGADARIDTKTLAVSVRDLAADVKQGEHAIELGLESLAFSQSQQIDVAGLSVTLVAQRNINVSAPKVSANLDAQTANVSDITVNSGEFKAVLSNLVVSKFIDSPSATGRLMVEPFNALSLLKDFDVDFEPANKQSLRSVGLSSNFSGSLDGAEVSNLKLVLDQSALAGSASIKDFEQPQIKFNLALDQLNLDDYLPATVEGAEEPATDSADALAVPMAVFKDVDANGQFKAKQLVSGGLELNDIDVSVVSTPGNVTITPNANLYDGKFGGQIAYAEKAGQAELRVKNEIDLVDLGKMLNAADVTDQLSGIGTLALDLLVTEKDGVQSNEGTIKLLAKNGAIQGVDIKAMVDQGLAKYQQLKGREQEEQETGESETSDETKFAELLGTFYLKDFKITNQDFAMKAPLFRLGGEGVIDIKTQTLDYLVNFVVVNSTSGQGGESLDKLKGINIPIRLRGDLTAPSYSLDMKALYKGLLAKEVDQKKDEYLAEKFGIEDGGKLSTKDALKQILLKKATKDDTPEERPIRDVGRSDGDTTKAKAPDEFATKPEQEPITEEVPEKPLTKKEAREKRKDDLKKKLIEGLFN